MDAPKWHELWRQRAVDVEATAAGELAVAQGFVVTRPQLIALGHTDNDMRRWIRRGSWCRPDRGVLSPVVITGSDPDADRQRHALRATAAALLRPGHVVTGSSGAILHGLPTLSVSAQPILTRRGPATEGRRFGIHVRGATLEASSCATWYGVPISSAARTVVDQGRWSRHDGIIAADAAVRHSLTTPKALREETARARGWPGVRQARRVIAMADGDAESPLESLVRLALDEDGFPPPALQQWVAGYRVDFLWEEYRLVVEADGRLKYADDALWAEKQRELALRRAGYDVERIVWADLFRGWPATSARLRPLFRFPSRSVVFDPWK